MASIEKKAASIFNKHIDCIQISQFLILMGKLHIARQLLRILYD